MNSIMSMLPTEKMEKTALQFIDVDATLSKTHTGYFNSPEKKVGAMMMMMFLLLLLLLFK